MAKRKMTQDEFCIMAINKMLEKHNVDFDFVSKNQKIDGKEWFQHYTWTEKESEIYKKWFIDSAVSDLKMSRANAASEYQWINLMYGLKIEG